VVQDEIQAIVWRIPISEKAIVVFNLTPGGVTRQVERRESRALDAQGVYDRRCFFLYEMIRGAKKSE
jgi:hypothetical protein